MGMPVIVEIIDRSASESIMGRVFDYFTWVDQTFSTFKPDSEISKINDGRVKLEHASGEMRQIFALAEQTKQEANGYFDIVTNDGKYDPSGIVKGWAIWQAATMLANAGFSNFYVEAGGDIQVQGSGGEGAGWKVGIKNPFNVQEIVKVVYVKNNEGIATSGTYERGAHIYNPKNRRREPSDIVSITVVGPNIYEADRFATAAFAMGREGIGFIDHLNGFAGYAIDRNRQATMTRQFDYYTHP